ncbi:gluconeogenesis factor YvcK family protein [Clostridium oryzae]|uniref:Putative gluconeogenesis factor n=1 Tax=Clostridium oryzae TaxID=1450648 RepID=A0A1V4IZ67_9CLOT|nr:gluconeogenesis factor YvcK family protein [Clostridium oryzae]OPJ65120.1 gluconeogenesis factor [Clostridium oryzae]
MKFTDWLRPGIKVKRWILFGIMGLLLILTGLVDFVQHGIYNNYYKAFWVLLNFMGIFVIYISITQSMKSIIGLINKGYINVKLDSKKLETLIYEKRLLIKGAKIVVIGGGTGLSTMLRGLKYYTSNITAIVTVADDGGGSGDLREDLGILPPGDIRNCILALADTEPLMEELLQYRFPDGKLKNQSFGNLFLAAMDGISSTFEEAVQKMSSVLAVTGKVLPVTLDNMVLKAKLKNGSIVMGESTIGQEAIKQKSPIERLFIEPEDAKAVDEAIKAIREADAIILGPGSLYTSVIPNILVKDIGAALKRSSAVKIYVSNIMTQPGETDGYDVADHIKAIHKHIDGEIIDYVMVNNGKIGDDLEEKYKNEGSNLVEINKDNISKLGVEMVEGDFVKIKDGYIRHDAENLASMLIETIMDRKLFYDKKKIVEYFYLSERLKQNKRNRE